MAFVLCASWFIRGTKREGDLLLLPWSAYNGTEIKLRQRKTGAYIPIPVADTLKAALDRAPRQSPIMLTNSNGKPWSESGFQGAWGKATTRAGIRGLTFHDVRGTAVVKLARAGCNEIEIYSITGHKPGDAGGVRKSMETNGFWWSCRDMAGSVGPKWATLAGEPTVQDCET